jgi:hypothetical protein
MVADPIYVEQTASLVTGTPQGLTFYRRTVVHTTPALGQFGSEEETGAIERDFELYHRVLARRQSSTNVVSLDEALNRLASDT